MGSQAFPAGVLAGRTWQGSSHFNPRHPGAHVHVPSRVLQAPPLRHWHVKLQPKPQVPLGQRMEQSTPCQPAMTRRPEHVRKQRQQGVLPSRSQHVPFRSILEMPSSVPAPAQKRTKAPEQPHGCVIRHTEANMRSAPGLRGRRHGMGAA